MIYLEIDGKNFVAGISWSEVIVGSSESKSDVRKNALKLLPPNANTGIIKPSLIGSVTSVGVLSEPIKEIMFPKIYSLGSMVSSLIKDGIFFWEFSLEDLSSKLPKKVLATVNNFPSTLNGSDIFYWACTVQDGVVVHDGEIIGSADDIANFIASQNISLGGVTVFGSRDSEIANIIDSPIINSNILDMLSEIGKEHELKQLKGVTSKAKLIGVGVVILGLTFHFYQEKLERDEAVMMAKQAIQGAMPVFDQAAENRRVEEELRQRMKVDFISEVNSHNLMDRKSVDLATVLSLYEGQVKSTPYGWRIESFLCIGNQCKTEVTSSDSLSRITDLTDYGMSMDSISINSDGTSAYFIIGVDEILDEGFDSNEAGMRDMFSKTPFTLDYKIKSIETSKLSGFAVPGIRWSFQKERDIAFLNHYAYEGVPSSVEKNNIILRHNDLMFINPANNFFRGSMNLSLEQVEINNSSDNSAAWGLKYSYTAKAK